MTPDYTPLPDRARKLLETGADASGDVAAVLAEIGTLDIPPLGPNSDGDTENVGGLTVTHRFVQAPGDGETIRWHYVEAGAGPPLVLLHGIPQSWCMWQPILPALAAHFRCIVLGLKGYGQTHNGRGDYRHEGVAQQVIALLDTLGIDTFSLFSHDRGTVQADHMVARIAPRVRRWIRGSQHLWHYHPDLSPQEHLFTNLETRDILQQPKVLLPRFFGWLCKYPMPRDAVVRAIQEFSRPGVGLAVERYFQSSTFRQEWLDRRTRLVDAWQCPTLILQGSDEPPMPREFYTDDVAARLPNARIAFVDGGHFYVEENPEGTLAAALRFLTDDQV
ncbi:MAG: alpha/beta fold hydrolase [Alphaproteobacteria bacterium]|nr:alpha/beta fold hydrolase [Alphaproteobacteria bacterium]